MLAEDGEALVAGVVQIGGSATFSSHFLFEFFESHKPPFSPAYVKVLYLRF